MNVTNRAEKLDEKMESIVKFPCSFPELWSLNCLRKCIFLKFYAEFSKKCKSIKAIYTYASERSRYVLSENGIVYYAMTYCFELGVEVEKLCYISAESASFLIF